MQFLGVDMKIHEKTNLKAMSDFRKRREENYTNQFYGQLT